MSKVTKQRVSPGFYRISKGGEHFGYVENIGDKWYYFNIGGFRSRYEALTLNALFKTLTEKL